MAVNNEYVNRVDANGQTLIDLTNDTATAGDVLEGRTLHLASGAPTTGTYRPSDEIEARLEATVGHSAINLFEPKYRQGTSANTTTTTAVCSLTVIPTEYGKAHTFRKYNSNFSIRIYGTNDEGKAAILSGGVLTQSLRLYEGSYIYDDSWTHTNETQGVTCYVIMVRKPNFPLADPVTYQNITPSDVPSNLVMITDSSISDDTFEPYVTPTDEKKQDKPVVLWEAAVGSTGVQTVALSALSQPLSNFSALKIIVCNCMGDSTITALDAYLAFIDIDLSLSNDFYGWCCTTFLGQHSESGHNVVDRIHAFAGIDASSIGINGYLNNEISPDGAGIPGTFIRKIIGIP